MPSAVPMRGLRMEDELYLKLKFPAIMEFIAKKESRSYNQEAVHILKGFVEQYEKEHGSIPVDTDALYQ